MAQAAGGYDLDYSYYQPPWNCSVVENLMVPVSAIKQFSFVPSFNPLPPLTIPNANLNKLMQYRLKTRCNINW